MSVTPESLNRLFPPDEAAIPEAWRLAAPLHQRQYLLDGQLHEWAGPTQEVLSPMAERQPDGTPGVGTDATGGYNPDRKKIGDEDWETRPPAIGLLVSPPP